MASKPTFLILLIFLVLCFSSCIKGQPKETLIYFNDFENGIEEHSGLPLTASLSDTRTEQVNGTYVLGRYGFDNFKLSLESIDSYDFIEISFDINIHDKWEGNGTPENSWQPDIFIFNIYEFNIIYSSFVNTGCQGKDCDGIQSYPESLGNINPENADAINSTLKGVCFFSDHQGGSKKFRFKKRFNQTGSSLEFTFGAQLTRVTSDDYCLKSWSIDNIEVVGINIPEIR